MVKNATLEFGGGGVSAHICQLMSLQRKYKSHSDPELTLWSILWPWLSSTTQKKIHRGSIFPRKQKYDLGFLNRLKLNGDCVIFFFNFFFQKLMDICILVRLDNSSILGACQIIIQMKVEWTRSLIHFYSYIFMSSQYNSCHLALCHRVIKWGRPDIYYNKSTLCVYLSP